MIEFVGKYYYRTQDTINSTELAFSTQWQEVNKRICWLNGGNGVLENLMCANSELILQRELTDQEILTASTVIQWLGTNNGMSFLRRVFESCGLEIKTIKEEL
jgi:hypothetical protein